MLEKEVKWWPLLSPLIIYCYCLQRLITSLKFANTKHDNYRLTLNCTEAHVTCDEELIKFSGREIFDFQINAS